MRLFNASSLFSEDMAQEALHVVGDPEKLKDRLADIKRALLQTYHFKAYRLPDDFTAASYVIATNHLTDPDAPLIISYHYALLGRPMFVFAKENCFNGVSIPKELTPALEQEKVFEVNRGSLGGAKAAMQAAAKWFSEGEKPRHFLIFAQGTIYDINKDKAEDIEPGAFWLARLLGIPVLPAFIEQAVEGEENRMVFAPPISIPRECRNFEPAKQLWLERVIEAQNALEALSGRPARPAVLDEAHQTRKRFR